MPGASRIATILAYAASGRHVFPYRRGTGPLCARGFRAASRDPSTIRAWWTRHPNADCGYWPGGDDIAVLDIDRKHGVDGLRTYGELDCPILPPTPTVLTPSGGLHLHFRMPAARIASTVGARGRGIGPGLDWRGDTGFVVLPTPGSAYHWGQWHYANCAPVAVPESLMPRAPRPIPAPETRVVRPSAALRGLVRFAASAPEGQRNSATFWAAARAGELVARGEIDAATAIAVIAEAATRAGLPRPEALRTAQNGVTTGARR